VSRCISAAEAAGAEKVIVVLGHRGDEIRRELCGRDNVIFAENPDFRTTQMFDSVKAGIRSAGNAERIMLCPVDVPLVKKSTISAILAENDNIVRPVCGSNIGHPIIIDRASVPSVLSYVGDGGLKGAIAALCLSVTDVEVDDECMTVDADTAEDYQRLCRMEDAL